MVCGMSSSNAFKPPVINGVGPSTVGIPANTTLSAIDFLTAKFSAISKEEWQPIVMRMQKKARITDEQRDLVYNYLVKNI